KAKVDAKPPVSRRSRKSEGSSVHDLEKRLAEALRREAEALGREGDALRREEQAQEQQTATAEILRVISQSPTDIQSVFETLLQRAVRLGAAGHAALF